MIRWIRFSLVVIFAFMALVFFLLNRHATIVDLYFGRVEMPVGLLVPLLIFLGFGLAGMVLFASVILPQRMRLRTLRREFEASQSQVIREKV